MRVVTPGGEIIPIGETAEASTIGIVDFSRRTTDDFGVTTVTERGFRRRLSCRIAVPFDQVDSVQRRLADLRGTPVRWEADAGSAWLSPTGFYQDFEIDLSVPPTSFCTLTIEGLAEGTPVVDMASDPAPEGMSSTLRMLLPVDVAEADLVTSVPEDDAPRWQADVTYPLGYRVIWSRRVFESVVAGNIGHQPGGPDGKWIDTGPTNRWALLDEALGTATRAEGVISVQIPARRCGALALLDLVAAAVRIQLLPDGAGAAPIYDRTLAVEDPALILDDLPRIDGTLTITVSGAGMVEIGTLLIGTMLGLGITEAAPTAGIIDFSRKQVDDFGEVTVVPRGWAQRMAARALIRSSAVDLTADRIAAIRARPVLWIAADRSQALTVYGFFREFAVEVGQTVSKLNLSIEGLSRAQPATLPWSAALADLAAQISRLASDGLLHRSEKPQVIIDRAALAASFAATNDRWLSLGSPTDVAPIRADAAAEIGALTAYLDGLVPAWNDPASDTPIDGAAYRQRWIAAHEAVARFVAAITGRSGEGGAPGLSNAPVFAYQRSAAGPPAAPTATAFYDFPTGALTGLNNGWQATIPAGSGPLYVIAATASSTGSADAIAAGEWAAPVQLARDGDAGQSGISAATIYLYQRTTGAVAPAPPAATATYAFATGVLTGAGGGWSQTIPPEAAGPNLWVTTATALAIAGEATDSIASGEWAAVRRLAQDGVSPQIISLAGTHSEFRFSGSGQAQAQTTRIVARRQNTGLQTIWRVLRADTGEAVSLYQTAAELAANGWVDAAPSADEIVIGHVRFGWVSDTHAGSGGLVYEAWLNGTSIFDSWSLARARDGATGTPGRNGVDGADGDDGIFREFVWRRAATQPAAPVGDAIPAGWSDNPPPGTDPLWMSVARQELDGRLIAGESWATPIRHDGPSGEDGRSITPAAAIITLSADYLGTIKPGQLPRTIQFACFAGGVDVTGQTVWAVESVSSDGSAVSISTAGLLTVSALASSSSLIVVRGIYQGAVLRARVGAAVVLDPAPPATATSLSVSVPSPGDESTFPPGPDASVTVSASPGGQIRADMGASYFVGGSAPFPQQLSWNAIVKIAYRLAGSGGAWIDVGVQEVGTAARRGWLAPGEPESNSGAVNISRTQSGLTAGAAYEVGVFVRASASGSLSGWFGTLTAGHP